jgi:hypothetical protein
MKSVRVGFSLGLVAAIAAIAPGCSSGEGDEMSEEDIGVLEQMARKGSPNAVNGQADYCFPASVGPTKCNLGEGDCDTAADCVSGLACVRNKGPQFGFLGDVCAPEHCGNRVKDGDETQIDCGGSCGSICAPVCAGLPPNGQIGHCTTDCPCSAGSGDCDTNAQCSAGTSCVLDTGGPYGFAAGTDMCLATTCSSGTQNGNETGVDCGGSCPPCPGTHVRSANFGGTSSNHGEAIVLDTAGNVFMAGRFAGTTDFGCGPMTSQGGTKSDVYVVKLSSAGSCLWSVSVGGGVGGDGDNGIGIDVDTAGNPVIGSNFYGAANFLGTPKTAVGSADMFVMKLATATGGLTWVKTFGGSGVDRVLSLDVDGSNNVHFTGAFAGSVNFGGGARASAGASDVAVVKLNSVGTHVWSQRFGGTGADIGYGVSVDSLGNVYVGGQFGSAVNFGTGVLTAAGASDGFFFKLNSTGTVTAFAKQIGGPADDLVRDVAVDAAGRSVVVGRFKTSIDLGNGPITAAGTHAFVVAYSNAGVYSYSKTIGGSGVSQALSVARDNTGDSAVVGYFQGNVNWGTGNVASAGADDLFIIRYSLAGALTWSAHYGSAAGDQAVAARFGGRLLAVAGRLLGSASVGGPVLTATQDALFAEYVF